ncbi:NAD-dependent protein deacylase 1 [Actinoplanes ianthinogenes]|uniref:NAD-dependent protein deacylase n=1 Tax=Actinoplanes ianthinogenes TaxID=122358 RepID=A0ABM7LNA4_9ACTN|nr:NAD-dependent deacylase [Actinoplanes ianthinogenes]BCJ40729.1 NAD-dependent protein deacylase 1 [Actinoplanes ianthinogenes]GGR43307.1 NAD-dependent protein deacylase 1 [Actinoplanes ianthinogenes]
MDLNEAAKLLGQARHVVVFTGAGMSAESGVPTFRDALTGLWSRFDAQALATPQAFDEDPALVWGWYEWRRQLVQRVRPHQGHLAVARMAAHTPELTVLTQNVDDLHERAGSTSVTHLHGSLFAPRCTECTRPAPVPDTTGDQPDEGRRVDPPRCPHCDGLIRPGVVWFGEALPQEALEAAAVAASTCDVLLTVGTSGLVYPAAEIPRLATRYGAAVIQVNPQPTPLDPIARVNLRGPAAEVLPSLVSTAWPQ